VLIFELVTFYFYNVFLIHKKLITMAKISLDINGKKQVVDVDPKTPVLWVLRDHLNLVGTKYGCGVAQCGACTILLEGNAVRSCSMPVSQAANKKITTIEGLSENGDHSVQKAWLEHDVAQCGYCQTGQIMTAAALLEKNPNPTDEEIESAMHGNICRCGTYLRIKAAVKTAANA
jgi:aerobic-type carbon monoxide dehydrogenase small subunit (CoxS/CutS family)